MCPSRCIVGCSCLLMNNALRHRWIDLGAWANGNRFWQDWLHRLANAYADPQRHYHTLRHVADCLGELDSVVGQIKNPLAVELAIWFHDVVYDVKASDNEEQSADVVVRFGHQCNVDPMLVSRVVQMVWATKDHAFVEDADTQFFLDIDLGILGQTPSRFSEYEEQVRAEYSHVTEGEFAQKRAMILQGLLDRKSIYATGVFQRRYEAIARSNLLRAIQQWRSLGF